MERLDRPGLALAVSLSGLAGYVDALGFLKLGGYYVSFMSGNSTQFGVDVVKGGPLLPLLLIAGFVAGACAGSLIGHFAGARRTPVVIGLVALLLLAAAGLHGLGLDALAVSGMVLAMGAENTVLEETASDCYAVTYVTGSLVQISQRLARAFLGGPRWEWIPYFLLCAGLVAGAIAGAASFIWWKLDSLWIAAAFALVLTAVTAASFARARHD